MFSLLNPGEMAGPIMDAAFLTYEGIASDPVENNLDLEQPVWLLGKYFKPDEGKNFSAFHSGSSASAELYNWQIQGGRKIC